MNSLTSVKDKTANTLIEVQLNEGFQFLREILFKTCVETLDSISEFRRMIMFQSAVRTDM
ncbi:MAG: hypothetical protein ACTS6A_01740 [Candidatus Hodgkinia cicadicola]